jgi:hypothetical protein
MELHILECVYCRDRALKFSDFAFLLRYDSEIRSLMEQAAKEAPQPSARKRAGIIKYILAAVIVLAVGIPTYWLSQREDTTVAVVQRLNLVPVRTSSDAVLDADAGGRAEIRFYVKGARPDQSYHLSIISRANDVVYSDDSFSAFSETGTGILVLPVDTFSRGYYTLTITDPTGERLRSEIEYTFRVE